MSKAPLPTAWQLTENIRLTNPSAIINEEAPINQDHFDATEDDAMEDSRTHEACNNHTEELSEGELADTFLNLEPIYPRNWDVLGVL